MAETTILPCVKVIAFNQLYKPKRVKIKSALVNSTSKGPTKLIYAIHISRYPHFNTEKPIYHTICLMHCFELMLLQTTLKTL